MDMTAALRELVIKDQIREVIYTAARASDRNDRELLKSCYHPDALEDHGSSFSGKAYDYIDRPKKKGASEVPVIQHTIGNILITLEDDVAYAESYATTFARMIKNGTAYDTFTGGRYCDKFTLRDGHWKIAYRKIVYDWNRDVPASESWLLGIYDSNDPKMHMGRRDKTDLSYQRF